MFIGRKKELQFFEERYHSDKAELIVLYGRRRVGKTELLREFSKDKKVIFYSSRECSDNEQLQLFSNVMLKKNHPASKYLQKFNDWSQAFESLLEIQSENKKILIIDEFPYMCKSNSSIPSILQNLWDNTLKNQNVMIILCGSAMSFIEKEILAEKNPLYGRATGIYKMSELSFAETTQFFPYYSFEEQLTAFAILGGIPYYLNQFNSKLSIQENIKKAILSHGSILFSEVEFLLRQELRETSIYNTIIQAIALGCTSMNDIYTRTGIEKTKLTAYLNNLIELELIQREFSVMDGIQETIKQSRGLYKLTNNFFRFWYSFIFPNYSEIECGDIEGVLKYEIIPRINEYVSITFEDVSQQYMRSLNQQNLLDFHARKVGRWWGKTTMLDSNGKKIKVDTEIDVCLHNFTEKQFIFGECKYTQSPIDNKIIKHLIHKVEGLGIQGTINLYYFSKNGFSDEAILFSQKNKNIHLITLDMIVEQLTNSDL